MQDRFSFETADDLIRLLTAVHAVLRQRTEQLTALYKHLGDSFRDEGYAQLLSVMQGAYQRSADTNQQLGVVIGAICRYRERLYQLYVGDLISQIGFEPIDYTPQERFGQSGEDLERKNRQLEFRNEVTAKIRNGDLSAAAKKLYAAVGSKCVVASNEYTGIASYSPSLGAIRFHLQEDLNNPCGTLSTYFHEIGHMIDHKTFDDRRLSDDVSFVDALRQDCENYISYTQNRFGCSREDAYYHIRMELSADQNLYADVSDIMGSLTECRCQNLWGHSLRYWHDKPERMQREAFANMFSVSMGSEQRIQIMKKYFPAAYSRFVTIMEDAM